MELQHRPEDGEQDRRNPAGGDELALEVRVDRRGRIAAAGHLDPLLRVAANAQRQDGEQGGPPDGQIDGDAGLEVHTCAAAVGSAISSISTPPISLGWRKITGTPWAPMRGSPVPSTVAPLARMSSRAAMMSGTSKQM